ncbi:MAG TPA: response regulator, partial [Blastocatellia bacterium]
MSLSGSQKSILFVDDDVDMVDLFKVFFSGYKVSCVYTVAEALGLAKVRWFDLYVLDNWMADGNGIELCGKIREFDPTTPIIFISAAGYEQDKQKALKAGAQAYFVKPVDLDDVKRTIDSLDREAEAKSLQARIEELKVIREELLSRRQEINARRTEAMKKKDQVAERLLKAKARIAFIEAGGTRANFER